MRRISRHLVILFSSVFCTKTTSETSVTEMTSPVRDVTKASPRPTGCLLVQRGRSFARIQTDHSDYASRTSTGNAVEYSDALWDVIGCYGYDVNIAAAAAQAANDKHGSGAFSVVSGARAIGAS